MLLGRSRLKASLADRAVPTIRGSHPAVLNKHAFVVDSLGIFHSSSVDRAISLTGPIANLLVPWPPFAEEGVVDCARLTWFQRKGHRVSPTKPCDHIAKHRTVVLGRQSRPAMIYEFCDDKALDSHSVGIWQLTESLSGIPMRKPT